MSDKKTQPAVARTDAATPSASGRSEIDAFIRSARNVAVPASREGRIILALDATMSRQPTWDLACSLQAKMFDAVGKTGKLRVQLAYFRGPNECSASRFAENTATLKVLMQKISCQGGVTQIRKILSHSLKETKAEKVQAIVFIGDAMEENVDELATIAAALGLAGTPVFIFQEGVDSAAEIAFKEIARLSRGAWFRFDRSSADKLASLLSAVAVYASGGVNALESRGEPGDKLLLQHLGGSR